MNTIESKAYCLPHDNIDTDQIIPAKFLKATTRENFGKHLFHNWRYDLHGEELAAFPLNSLKWGNEILVTGNNFGCGSSREHAAWAISDYGIKAVISSKFADIFKGNAYNNGILPVEIRQELVELISAAVQDNPNHMIKISVEEQVIVMDAIGLVEPFEIDPIKKKLLLNDTTETDYLISLRQEIEDFEAAHAILNL